VGSLLEFRSELCDTFTKSQVVGEGKSRLEVHDPPSCMGLRRVTRLVGGQERAREVIFLNSTFFVLGFASVCSLAGVLLQTALSTASLEAVNAVRLAGGSVTVAFGVLAIASARPLTVEGQGRSRPLLDLLLHKLHPHDTYLNAWYSRYRESGPVIVGVHTPEFQFEKDFAVRSDGIEYPVALDSNYATWNSCNNHLCLRTT
jgi:hypothetical protein